MTECEHNFERTIAGHGCRGATRVCRCGLSERFHDYMVERARGPLVERLRAALEHVLIPLGREGHIPRADARRRYEALLKEPSAPA